MLDIKIMDFLQIFSQIKSQFFLEFIYTLFTLYILSQSLTQQIYEVRLGRLFTYVVIPWVTTGPETITAVIMLLKGLPVACLFNCIFSAIFDLFLVMPIIAVSYRFRTGSTIRLDPRPWLLLIPVLTIFTYFGLDLRIESFVEGVALTSLVLLTVVPIVWYGVGEF